MSEQQQILTIDDMTSAYIALNNKGAGMCLVEFTPQEHQAGYPADCTLNMTPQEIYEAIENGSTVYARCTDPAIEFEGQYLLKVFVLTWFYKTTEGRQTQIKFTTMPDKSGSTLYEFVLDILYRETTGEITATLQKKTL